MAGDREHVSDSSRRRRGSPSPDPDMSMMRVAVAGTGGLARLIAHYIDEDTSHHVVFLSRSVRSYTRSQVLWLFKSFVSELPH